jgi:transcriptional regulator with XRE-family HTH domain
MKLDPVTSLLERILIEDDLSQRQLAAKLQVTESLVSKYFSGASRPGRHLIARLLLAFPPRSREILLALTDDLERETGAQQSISRSAGAAVNDSKD